VHFLIRVPLSAVVFLKKNQKKATAANRGYFQRSFPFFNSWTKFVDNACQKLCVLAPLRENLSKPFKTLRNLSALSVKKNFFPSK